MKKKTCDTCKYWKFDSYGEGECKKIKEGISFVIKAGWEGGFVETVLTDEKFSCGFYEKGKENVRITK